MLDLFPLQIRQSIYDDSINFIWAKSNSAYEARFVYRVTDSYPNGYPVIYISTFDGCRQACRMCHLTKSKQVSETAATNTNIIQQITTVIKYVLSSDKRDKLLLAEKIHVNFMARGEPLLNPELQSVKLAEDIISTIKSLIKQQINVKIKVSTIFPRSIWLSNSVHKLKPFFDHESVELYFSLYTTDLAIRKRWLPNSVNNVLTDDFIKTLGGLSKRITIHHAVIPNVNTQDNSSSQIVLFAEKLKQLTGVVAKFNLVQYNDFIKNVINQDSLNSNYMTELSFNNSKSEFPISKLKVIKRVGYDVKASCGMFHS